MRRLIQAGCVLLLAGCSGGGPSSDPVDTGRTVRFVAFGDAGTGSERQIAVGEAMAAVCEARGCDFALELGDNFYMSGVDSVDDAQFQSKFERPYEKLKGPIYVTLGNHDNSNGPGEGSGNRKGDYQVDYHYLAGRVSDKWRMPARYYSFTAGGGLAEFFSLDSNPLTALVPDPDPAWNYSSYGAAQKAWLKEGLQASKAPWKIAFAHHPYLSNGLHGNAGSYGANSYNRVALPTATTANGGHWKQLLEETICAHQVDIFFQGHDHDLQWIKPVASCGQTQFIVSGAAEGPRTFDDPNRNATYWQIDNTLGFFWFELSERELRGAAFTLGNDLKLPLEQGRPKPAFEQRLAKPIPRS